MKIAVYGLGYVGLTTVACAIKTGHSVHGVDVNGEKLKMLAQGISPIHEPGLEELIAHGVQSGRFTMTQDPGEELLDADAVLVCVGTPSQADGSHNMTYIIEVSRQIAAYYRSHSRGDKRVTVAYRSTMKPGSMEHIVLPLFAGIGEYDNGTLALTYHPEFLRESTAIADYFSPPKIVYGTRDSQPDPVLETLYRDIEAPRFAVPYAEAEMTKFIDNTWHALKVAFANEIGRIANSHGVSAQAIYEIFVADTKLNISKTYLRPGGAFGGSCLPKDVRALDHMARSVSLDTPIVQNVVNSNERHKRFLYERAVEGFAKGSRVLLIGLAFKDDSDDLRESPLLDFANWLHADGFELTIHDPHIRLDKLHATNLNFLLTRFPAIGKMLKNDPADLAGASFDVIMDGRNRASALGVSAERTVDLSSLP